MPNLIKYQCVIGKWNNGTLDYMYNDDAGIFDDFICNLCNDLNDEVEIIEEQEEIDIQSIQEIQFPDNTNLRDTRDLIINQLVKAVKQLDKKNDN